jgi:polyphosphate kinase
MPVKKSIKPRFFNRELSWIAFNERVLDQAFSEKYPLLERTRFLSFVSSNLDQFYEIRVAGLMQKVDAGITRPSLDGSQPKELLEEVRNRAHAMSQREYSCWRDVLKPALAKEKIAFKEIEELIKAEFTWLRAYFRREVFPVLTPLAVDPTHPFPLILNKSLNLFVSLRNLRKKQAPRLRRLFRFQGYFHALFELKRKEAQIPLFF